MVKTKKYTSNYFDYTIDFKNTNFREHPEMYQVGREEQGVLMIEPYKSEILPNWRFKNAEIAETSAKKIYQQFLDYKKQKDFVGMDMARKFLQMGYTRSRRYANHKSGKKYESNPQKAATKDDAKKLRKKILPQQNDALTNEKAKAAKIFYGFYLRVRNDKIYVEMKKTFQEQSIA